MIRSAPVTHLTYHHVEKYWERRSETPLTAFAGIRTHVGSDLKAKRLQWRYRLVVKSQNFVLRTHGSYTCLQGKPPAGAAFFVPPSLAFPNQLVLTSCPPSPLPLFILLHHCPSSATYLILFADSLQPLMPLFLKEKELKLAGEMNNVTAINGGLDVSVFSCVWGWRDDSKEARRRRWSGLRSCSLCSLPTFAQIAEKEKWFPHGDFPPRPAAISLSHKIFEPLTFYFLWKRCMKVHLAETII